MSGLSLWTVYDRPRDYPDEYVARRWQIDASGAAPTGDLLRAANLDELRAQLPPGLCRMAPYPDDDRCILETWL